MPAPTPPRNTRRSCIARVPGWKIACRSSREGGNPGIAMSLTLSIVTPARNAERHLREAMLSVITQAGDFAIDYAIQDGGSGDATLAIVAEFQQLLDEKRIPLNCNGVTLRVTSEQDS